MDIDRNGLEIPDRGECLQLLASATIGRVSLSNGALPTVLPVNFVLTEQGIVFRTGRGTKLDAATHNAVVAFETDDIDVFGHTGWSVVVTGMAREITDPDERARAATLPLAHWSLGPADRYVRISLEIVTGRRIVGPEHRLAAAAALAAAEPAEG